MPSDWEEKIDSIVAGRWCFIVAAFVLAIVAAQRAIQGAYLPWYDVRLAATFRIREFGELYSASDAGAILCTLYPPLAHLFYLPATIFSTPNAALITASALAIVVCLATVAGTIFSADSDDRGLRGLVFLFVAWHMVSSRFLMGAWGIHADAPSFAFGIGACALAIRGRPVSAAIAGSCALWAKQTSGPFLIALAAYYLLRGDRPALRRFIASCAVANVVAAGLFSAWFGFENLLFGLFGVAGRQPISPLSAFRLDGAIATSLDLAVLVAIILFAAAGARKPLTEILPAGVWLFLGAALALVPLGALGRMKYGGDINSYGAAHLCLVLGLALGALAVCAAKRELARPVRLTLAAVVALQVINAASEIVHRRTDVTNLETAGSQAAFRFAREHPAEAYFPWHPMASLMAEGELYHAGYGLFDWTLADLPVSDERFRKHLPTGLRYVAFQQFGQEADREVMRRLPEFGCRAELEELAGWTVFERCDATTAEPAPPSVGTRQLRDASSVLTAIR